MDEFEQQKLARLLAAYDRELAIEVQAMLERWGELAEARERDEPGAAGTPYAGHGSDEHRALARTIERTLAV